MTGRDSDTWPVARWREFIAAGSLLTRLPLPRVEMSEPGAVANGVWAYPVFGALIGGIGAAAYALAHAAGLPPSLGAVAALGATALATGALHEDGLADFSDGVGGGATREKKLQIMEDSSVGTYGAVALILSLAARWGAIAALTGPLAVAVSLVAAHLVSRSAITIIFLLLGPAKSAGLGAAVGKPGLPAVTAACLIAASLCLALLPVTQALVLLLAGLAAVLLVTWLSARQIGGYTGDVFGAAQQAAEVAVLWTVLAFGTLSVGG